MVAVGLQLLWHSLNGNLTCKEDAAVAIIHWIFLKNEFKCLHNPEDEHSVNELLPENWNQEKDVYSLFYHDGKDKYQVKIIKADHVLIINTLNIREEKVGFCTIRMDHITDEYANFSKKLCDSLNKFIEDVEKSLSGISAVKAKNSTENKEERGSPGPSVYPLRNERFRDLFSSQAYGPDRNPLAIGRSDLDPLCVGGGGMLMDIRHPPSMIRPGNSRFNPAIPPGSRFDPIGPIPISNRDIFNRPDPDHLPPPGYDDMFM